MSILFSLSDALARGCHNRPAARSQLLAEIKRAILLHDRVDIQAGGLVVKSYEDMCFSHTLENPTVAYKDDVVTGQKVSLIDGLGNTAMLDDQAVWTSSVSLEVLLPAEIKKLPSVQLVRPTDAVHSAGDLQRHMSDAHRAGSARSVAPQDDVIARQVAASVAQAQELGSLLALGTEGRAVYRRAFQQEHEGRSVVRETVFENIVRVRVPDFYRLEFAAIADLRSDPLWADFRLFLNQMVESIVSRDDPSNLQPSDVWPGMMAALLKELDRRQPSGKQLAIDIGINVASLIPGLGQAAAAAASALAVTRYHDGKIRWLTYLDRLAKKADA